MIGGDVAFDEPSRIDARGGHPVPILSTLLGDDDRPARQRILGIGELLWDLFPDGPRLGGAPFNVIANLRRLGHEAAFVTAVGDDDLGREALRAADGLGIEATFISVALDLPTGTVAVEPDATAGHRFVIRSPAAYESIGDGDALVARVATWRPDALVYGTLAQRFAGARRLTGRIATKLQPRQRLYDVNLRDRTWTDTLVLDLLGLATIVKANDEEARVLATLLGCDASPVALGQALGERFGIEAVCITRGPEGAALFAAGHLTEAEGIRIEVVDTVGAGDAFAAGLLHKILEGQAPADALGYANRLGALVASRPGALPPWTADEVG
jgi:fructokinase